MIRYNYLFLLLCLVVLSAGQSLAQNKETIDRLSIADGLSNSAARHFFQDHHGFMWIGTNDGLNRYDGYEFSIFRHNDKDTSSVAHNWINAIAEDASQKLWIGTHEGVSIYDYIRNDFSSVSYFPGGSGRLHKLSKDIEEIMFDKKGTAYLKVDGEALVVFERDGYRSGKSVPLEGKGYNYAVQSICIDSSQHIWVFVNGAGLCRYVPKQKKLVLVNNQLTVASRMINSNGSLWICRNEGMEKYMLPEGAYRGHYSTSDSNLSLKRINGLIKAGPDELWIGSDGDGVTAFNERSGKFERIFNGNDGPLLTSNAVLAIYKDRRSRIWIGTYRGGVNIVDPYKSGFQNIKHEDGNPNSLPTDFVLSICEQSPGKLWIGTDGGGVSLLDRNTGKFQNFIHRANDPYSLGGNVVTSILKEVKGAIWLASYDGYISRYNAAAGNFEHHAAYSGTKKLSGSTFWTLLEDQQHNIWAGALNDGLFLLDRESGQFRQFDPKLSNLLVLHQDRSGQLWGGAWRNLVRINNSTKKHEFYWVGHSVRAIAEDKNGDFWLGTEGGLMLFDRKQNRIKKRYTTDDGLANDHIMNILTDRMGNLWLSTFNGLSRFDIQDKTFRTYSSADGLPEKEFNYNSAAVLTSGELAFGNIRGLTLFFPEKVSQRRSDPVLVFTGLSINNQPAGSSEYVTATRGSTITAVEVPYDQAVFTFNFTAIDFPFAEHISYRYRLLHHGGHWINGRSSRSASYGRLEPGTYDFQVNCTNKDGRWVQKVITVRLVILPPWYRTWLAYGIYTIIALSLVYAYSNYRVHRTRLKYEVVMARESAREQRALQEKEREIHNNRIEFFTSISHEFRTPLSLIINPIRDMLMRVQDGNEADLKIVYRNARRLLSLVDQLLLFRKASFEPGEIRVAPLDIVELCTEVFHCFSQQAKSSGIDYHLTTTAHNMIIYGDREKLEIILFNLISNALKFTPAGGSVKVLISDGQERVSIEVEDSGCGISMAEAEHIFGMFYQSRTKGRPAKSGFGIGLYLARQFAESHHGILEYQSEPNKGTTFNLSLKKGKEHFDPAVISAETHSESVMLRELLDSTAEVDAIADTGHNEFKAADIFSERKTILVVDDDQEIRSYIKSIFSAQYLVFEAGEGETAMRIVKEQNPDLVISDVMMPGMSGIEWCNWLKSDPLYSNIPVILLTASNSSETKLKGMDCGADDYISKPFEKDLLIARVANLLSIRSSLRSYFYNEITLQANPIAISDEYRAFLEKCIEVVERHQTNPQFNIKVLAAEVGMSHSNLYRKVKSLSGYTVTAFIRVIRLRKAAEMLINSEYNINQVSLETGFNNIKYFRAQFFKLFGMTPSEFVRRNKPVFQKKVKIRI